MSKSDKTRDTRGLPEMPRDLPMPVYRYQEDERFGKRQGDTHGPNAATLLQGAGLMGCAAAPARRP